MGVARGRVVAVVAAGAALFVSGALWRGLGECGDGHELQLAQTADALRKAAAALAGEIANGGDAAPAGGVQRVMTGIDTDHHADPHARREKIVAELRRFEQKHGEGSSIVAQRWYFTELLLNETWIKQVLQIGFNVGIGAATFLSAREDVRVVSLDLGKGPHVTASENVIRRRFGEERHRLRYFRKSRKPSPPTAGTWGFSEDSTGSGTHRGSLRFRMDRWRA
eukprot:Hpha_TRINITY_DN4956_c0_g1::TRINITY_DN4956_c0_g1_i2::g.51298::m.51298